MEDFEHLESKPVVQASFMNNEYTDDDLISAAKNSDEDTVLEIIQAKRLLPRIKQEDMLVILDAADRGELQQVIDLLMQGQHLYLCRLEPLTINNVGHLLDVYSLIAGAAKNSELKAEAGGTYTYKEPGPGSDVYSSALAHAENVAAEELITSWRLIQKFEKTSPGNPFMLDLMSHLSTASKAIVSSALLQDTANQDLDGQPNLTSNQSKRVRI